MHDNTVFSILKCAKNVYLSPKSDEKNNVYIAVRIDKVQFFAGCGIVRNLVFYKRKYEKKYDNKLYFKQKNSKIVLINW